MNNHVGKVLRWVLIVGIVLLTIICRMAAGTPTEVAWEQYAQWKALPPPAVGSIPQSDTPRAHSIAEMESLDLFVVEQVQEQWDDTEHVYTGRNGSTYKILTLDSGERVACQAGPSEYDYYDSVSCLWTSPIGRWTPWALDDVERASIEWKNVGLTTLDYYVDMTGETRDEAYTQFHFWFRWALTLVMVVVILLLQWLLLRPTREITRVRNDVEKWLAGTHAIWGQEIAEINRIIPGKRPPPIRFGGVSRTLITKWEIQMILKQDWSITNYQELLETVDDMSHGPGFTHCERQSALAWQLCRCTSLLGMAMVMGWGSRTELVERSREIGKLIQTHFSSWDELAMAFLEQYSLWRTSEGGDVQGQIQERVDIYHSLKKRSDSPYCLPWNLDLDQKK